MAGVVMVGDIEGLLAPHARDVRRERFGEAEIEHLDRAVGAHLHVRRLQVAMDDALSNRIEGMSKRLAP
jgi:hypothetical protein